MKLPSHDVQYIVDAMTGVADWGHPRGHEAAFTMAGGPDGEHQGRREEGLGGP